MGTDETDSTFIMPGFPLHANPYTHCHLYIAFRDRIMACMTMCKTRTSYGIGLLEYFMLGSKRLKLYNWGTSEDPVHCICMSLREDGNSAGKRTLDDKSINGARPDTNIIISLSLSESEVGLPSARFCDLQNHIRGRHSL